jgi:hypothetical protein
MSAGKITNRSSVSESMSICLMPNHAHLLLESGSSPLGKFMQGLQQSYTQTSTAAIARLGSCSKDDTKRLSAQRTNTYKYLLALVRYIHLNPKPVHRQSWLLFAHVGFQDDPTGGQDGFCGLAKPRQLPREDNSGDGAKTAADRDHQRSADLVGGPAH